MRPIRMWAVCHRGRPLMYSLGWTPKEARREFFKNSGRTYSCSAWLDDRAKGATVRPVLIIDPATHDAVEKGGRA